MKVALVTNYWKDSPGGGIKVYLTNLAAELRRSGVDLQVIYREGYDPASIGVPGSQREFALKAFHALRQFRPDVIHAHGDWQCLFPGVLYKQLYGATLIQTFHSEPAGPLSDRFRIVYQQMLNRCDCVTFVSNRLMERTVDVWKLNFRKTAVTYAGAPENPGASGGEIAAFRERFGIGDSAIVLLALGMTALSYKAAGLKVLIRAVRQLREAYPEIVLIATRRGACSGELQDFARKEGIADRVIFTGDLDNPFVPLQICDIYTHITLGDGLPIALLEAMSAGKPIIATPIAGIPEAIRNGKNGLLVEPDADLVAASIDHLIRNRAYAEELGRRARRTIEERFTWRKSAETFMSIYLG